jgi:inosine-uridine nucleoside N-ribohydrolase
MNVIQLQDMAEKIANLVIDTDVGLDDATALILCCAAQKKGRANVWGVTCVHGNTTLQSVCSNTLKTLHTVDRLDVSARAATCGLCRVEHCACFGVRVVWESNV